MEPGEPNPSSPSVVTAHPNTPTRSNLRFCTLDGLFATPWSTMMVPGGFLTAALISNYFGIGPLWFGIIAAMPPLANMLQAILLPAVARFMRVRELTLTAGWFNLGIWFSGVVGIAFLSRNNPDAGVFFSLLYFGISLSAALGGVGWMTWLGDFVPERIRGRYLSVRNRQMGFVTLAFMGCSLLILELTHASKEAYIGLLTFAVGGRLLSMLFQHRIESLDPTGGEITSTHWVADLGSSIRNRDLRRFILFGIVLGFANGAMSTVVPLFAFEALGFTPSGYTGLNLTSSISGMVFLRIWGRMIDRHGALPTLILSGILWRATDIGWILLTPETSSWLYLVWFFGGASAAGFLLASFNLLLRLAPRKSRSATISLNIAVTSAATFVGPIIAGYGLRLAADAGWDTLTRYRLTFLIAWTLTLLALLFLRGIREPHATPATNTIPGAMRTLRNLLVTQGLGFLANVTFIGRRHRPVRRAR